MSAWGRGGAVEVILREHEQLASVNRAMQEFVNQLGAKGETRALIVLRAMLYYIREYPQQVHHPKEDHFLFARLRARTHELDHVIDKLESQHVQGNVQVQELENALTRYELVGDAACASLKHLVNEYVEFSSNHRRLEEDLILPGALRFLTNEDWDEVNAAFGANRDPFDGVKLEEDLDRLFTLIVNTIPR
ncbi:hemerythrin domain-containing protein [Paraburkholderia sp. MM5384-R2]|uniref:hemerythrin domain-containing protein n=1 Tax=Paraburkholderia sp. MM5384-R2 TaxID=2723097 RepID=UPI001622F72B|nr:hemerythrin domain-containing protein [Paraburkholderia sp. MM5384-R2]MBB5503290.1 hemerythrin-like domain-containing protein [Paraburkholderia sp. MM5384-R2]